IKECLENEWVSSAGKYVETFEQKISEYTGAKHSVACINGTSALQVSLRLAGVEPGDEVIVPTLTFIAPINAVFYSGAKPVFMDVDKYYNIDIEKTTEFIKNETEFKNGITVNKTTKSKISAIIPVHVWGNAAQLDELIPLCKKRNIKVVEDASESLGSIYTDGKYSGKSTGTIGTLGCLSFNGNKIITTGSGGMILTDDKKLAEKAHYLTTQAKDDPVRYIHNEVGYNFRLSNIQAALGVAQLEQLPDMLDRKQEIHKRYTDEIETIDGLSIARGPNYARNNHWMNLLQIESEIFGETPKQLMNRLEENNVQTRPVWTLNHLQKPYQDCQSYQIEKAEELVRTSLCLPSSTNLTYENLNKVIKLIG
ncbi:MAG: LegC family aminotransferase, partial [Candidatus Marinimicrobia bacterium]|nr:LegC family aminotransferase [Candidatus Neomarinimicrobiota bacterium]